MANQITLSTGLQTFEIVFKDRGVTTEIKFNPADTGLATRFKEMQNRITDGLKGLTDIELDENGRAKDLSFVDNIEKIDKLICEEIDRAFGNEISEEVFRFCSPLAITGNEYFILQFIRAVSPVIEENIKSKNKTLNKHLAKYSK